MPTTRNSCRVFVCLFVLLYVCIAPVLAASSVLDISPESLTVSAIAGDPFAGPPDTGLSIRNLENNSRDLSIFFVRTKETGEYTTLQPKYLAISLPAGTIGSRGIVDVPLRITTQNLKSGEYRGTLLVLSNTTEISIPLTLKVKDTFWFPLIVLILTVTASVLVFNWGQSWKKYTILRRNLAELRGKVEGDELLSHNEFAAYFRQKIVAALDDAESKLQASDIEKADEARKTAEQLWSKWILNRVSWKENLEQSVKIEKEINDRKSEFSGFKGEYHFLDEIIEDLKKSWQKIADSKDEKVDFSEIDALDKYPSYLQNLVDAMMKTQQDCQNSDKQDECCKKFRQFISDLQKKSKSDLDFVQLQKDLNSVTAPAHAAGKGAVKSRGGVMDFLSGVDLGISRAPRIVTLTPPARVAEILSRRITRAEFVVGTLLPIFILMVAGMLLLYLPNPTFGSAADYLSLIIWGVMSCVAKDGIWEKISPLVASTTPSSSK